jgi:SWI/SNF-related matrix-associated actin-dependent regulator of chromatin subfamily A member 5
LSEQELENEIASVIAELDQISAEYEQKTKAKEKINKYIEEMRKQLFELDSRRTEIQTRKRDLSFKKATAERQLELAREQKQIEREFALLKEEAETLIADAPWRNGELPMQIKDYQVEGAIKLAAAGRALCGDKRGLGKTLQSLAWRRQVKSKKTLYLTRKEYARRLMREIGFWEPKLPIIPLIGSLPDQRKLIISMLKKHDEFVVVANFEMWRRSIDETVAELLSIGFDAVVIDEAHQLKNIDTATTKGFNKIAQGIPFVLEMTGSPIQNRPVEMFALLHILYPTIFPSPSAFARDYCYQYGQNKWGWAIGGAERLAEKTKSFFIARDYKDIGIEKPEPFITEDTLSFDGYSKQKKAYQAMAELSLAELEDGRVGTIVGVLALMTRLAQAVVWPAGIVFRPKDEDGNPLEPFRFDVHESVKMDWAEDLIKELVEEEQRVILFSRFKEPLFELRRRLTDVMNVGLITGETHPDTKDEILIDFDLKTAPAKPKYSTLIATYDTVSESVDLNAARHLIQLDRYWKPSRDDQAIGRIDRMNNTDQANVYRNTVEGSIDEFMNELIEEKTSLISEFRSVHEMTSRLKDYLEATI